MQCPQCHQDNPPQANFCLACGIRLTLMCSACGTELPAGARFCLACGQPVQALDTVQSRSSAPVAYTPKHLAEKILTSRSALEGERKQSSPVSVRRALSGVRYVRCGSVSGVVQPAHASMERALSLECRRRLHSWHNAHWESDGGSPTAQQRTGG